MKRNISIIILLVFGFTYCNAQKSISGKLILEKREDREFVLKNTKVMMRTGARLDSTSVNSDLTFAFDSIRAESVVLYLKSPVISPHAVTKISLKKKKPTKVSLDYGELHELTQTRGREIHDRDDDVDFERVATALIILRTIAEIIFIFRHH